MKILKKFSVDYKINVKMKMEVMKIAIINRIFFLCSLNNVSFKINLNKV